MKKITKKIILIIVTIVLAIFMQSIVAKQVKAEVKSGEIKDMKWSFDTATGTLTLSGKTKEYTDFFEAIEVNPKDVKVIKVGKDVEYLNGNFEKCDNVTTLELENEKTLKSESVMAPCKNLRTVKCGNDLVEKYDENTRTLTFSGKGIIYCSFITDVRGVRIENIKIEEGITEIGDSGRMGDYTVTKISLPESLISIGSSAFLGSEIESIELPSKLEKIGHAAFSCCSSLKKIELPDSVKELGTDCFGSCKELEEIKFSSKLEEIPKECFAYCDSLKEVTLPKNIKKIDPSAFFTCEKLTKLNIENVECENFSYLDSSYIKYLTDLKMGDIQYKFDQESGTLEVSGSKKIVNANSATRAFGQLAIKTLIIKDAEEIGDECFGGLGEVEKIELPDSLTTIGEECFQGMTKLSEITISKNVEKIGKESFKNCKELTIKAEDGSEAQSFAKENDIDFEVTKKSLIKGISGVMLPIIIGCVIGGILFIVLIVVIIVVVVKSKKKKQTT